MSKLSRLHMLCSMANSGCVLLSGSGLAQSLQCPPAFLYLPQVRHHNRQQTSSSSFSSSSSSLFLLLQWHCDPALCLIDTNMFTGWHFGKTFMSSSSSGHTSLRPCLLLWCSCSRTWTQNCQLSCVTMCARVCARLCAHLCAHVFSGQQHRDRCLLRAEFERSSE